MSKITLIYVSVSYSQCYVNSIVKMKVCLTENVGNSQKDRVGDISLHLHHTAKHTEMGTKSDQITK